MSTGFEQFLNQSAASESKAMSVFRLVAGRIALGEDIDQKAIQAACTKAAKTAAELVAEVDIAKAHHARVAKIQEATEQASALSTLYRDADAELNQIDTEREKLFGAMIDLEVRRKQLYRRVGSLADAAKGCVEAAAVCHRNLASIREEVSEFGITIPELPTLPRLNGDWRLRMPPMMTTDRMSSAVMQRMPKPPVLPSPAKAAVPQTVPCKAIDDGPVLDPSALLASDQ